MRVELIGNVDLISNVERKKLDLHLLATSAHHHLLPFY